MSAITPLTSKAVETPSSAEANRSAKEDVVHQVASSALSAASSSDVASTTELSERVSSGKEEADPETSSNHKYATLKGTGLFVGGAPVAQPKKATRRRRILSKLFTSRENLDVSSQIADVREIYTNHLIKLREANSKLGFQELTDKFLSEIPADSHPLLKIIGLDTAESIESFFDFLELRYAVEEKTVSPEFDPSIVSKQKPEDIISSFRCAKQPKPPTGFENIPFLALNDIEIPLPTPWDSSEKGFFAWLFKECNALFNVDYSLEKMVTEFCEQNDSSNIPYIKALQALTISVFAPIATSITLKNDEGPIKIKYDKYCYKISYNPEDQTFTATQIKVAFFKPSTEPLGEDKKLGRVIMHLSVSGKIGDDRTEVALQFKNIKFNMGEHYSVWNQMVQLLDAIE